MLGVKHLSKTFKTSGSLVKALDDVSFTLPSKGLVFITGKSGTGKSTLLSLIGGLSKIEKGEIYFNNIRLNDLNENELSFYRNEYIGFMFQDFNIFDNLTVYQNIELALMIKGEKNEDRILKEIERFELTPFIHQKVNRLSVGQKERVALLRAIVKDPAILLCDEPTGNLDTLTSEIILKRLEEESKNKLVVVITHNLTEAYKYASRIIKLDEGKIVEDISFPYSKREALIMGRKLYINDLRNLTFHDHKEISNGLSKHGIASLDSVSSLFVPTCIDETQEIETELHNKRMKKHKFLSFNCSLFKKDFFRNLIYLFIGVIALSVFSVCFMFYTFDTEKYFVDELDKSEKTTYNFTNYILNESGVLSMTGIQKLDENENNIVTDGKYFLANTSQSLTNKPNSLKIGNYLNFDINYKKFFAVETLGTIYGIDENYIKETFNLDEVEIIELAPYKKEGVYLTDYVYDSIKFYNPNLSNIGGDYFLPDSTLRDGYINGVIKTNYLEYFKNKYDISPTNFPTYNKDNVKTYNSFVYELSSIFNVTYSFEKEFLKELIGSDLLDAVYGVSLTSEFSEENITENVKFDIYQSSEKRNVNTLFISKGKINSLSNKKLSLDEWNALLKDKEIEISYKSGLINNFIKEKICIEVISDDGVYADRDFYNKLKNITLGNFGMVFCNNNLEVAKVLKRNLNNGIYLLDRDCNQHVVKIIELYKDLFIFIGCIVLTIGLFIFLYLGYETVKRLTFEIGVLKGIGININDLSISFILNSTLLFLIGAAIYFSTTFLFINILNPLLRSSIYSEFLGSDLTSLVVFSFSLSSNFVTLGALLLALILGTLIPILKAKHIKPIDILKRL